MAVVEGGPSMVGETMGEIATSPRVVRTTRMVPSDIVARTGGKVDGRLPRRTLPLVTFHDRRSTCPSLPLPIGPLTATTTSSSSKSTARLHPDRLPTRPGWSYPDRFRASSRTAPSSHWIRLPIKTTTTAATTNATTTPMVVVDGVIGMRNHAGD